MAWPMLQAIPKQVRLDLIGLALLQCQLRKLREAEPSFRERVEARMPGASSLVSDFTLVAALIQEHNARAKKLGAIKAVKA